MTLVLHWKDSQNPGKCHIYNYSFIIQDTQVKVWEGSEHRASVSSPTESGHVTLLARHCAQPGS